MTLRMDYAEANRFGPSRSAVVARNGMVATSQPVAALAGVDILRQGGNAVDAAVATAAMLNVVEPMSTGIGGDAFALIAMAGSDKVLGLNASGRAPSGATREEYVRRLGEDGRIDGHSILAVTIPGAAAGWADAVARCGRMPLADVLAPAIAAAEDGFAVTPQIANAWRGSKLLLSAVDTSSRTWLPNGRAPRVGEVFRNPGLARTLRAVAEGGAEAFYCGAVADAIARCSEEHDGCITRDDLAAHESTWVEPISVDYRGYQVLEIPPNGQGIAALEALNICALEDVAGMGHNSADTLHLHLEAMKLGFQDRDRYVTDMEFVDVPVDGLLSKEYAEAQRARIDMSRAEPSPSAGVPGRGDTVYLSAADSDGNLVSFINSLYSGWGSGITAGDTGVMLQNRGQSFSLDPTHANVIAPGKRTRHTIIPGMLARDGKPLISFGIMGGDMQAQGHVQFVCNVVDFGMNVQDALDAPRWRYDGSGADISLERWIDSATQAELVARGHALQGHGGFFGGGQAVYLDHEHGTVHGGSDPRRDGCAIGY
jgi:gamma-glutamyltranspeptidase / glutathione hydrolase